MVDVGPLTVADLIRRGHRPGWMPPGPGWREQLAALTEGDIALLDYSWRLASGPPPAPDHDWLTFDRVR